MRGPVRSATWSTSASGIASTSSGSSTSSCAAGARNEHRYRNAAGRGRPDDVRPDRAGVRRDEPRDDGRARPALAQGGRRGGRQPRRPRARRLLRHRRLGAGLGACRRAGDGPRLLRADARAGARQVERDRVGAGRRARAPVRGRLLRRGDGRLRRPKPREPGGWARRAAAGASAGRAPRRARDHAAARSARAVLPPLVRARGPAHRSRRVRQLRLHVPPCERAPLSGAGRVGGPDPQGRLRRGSLPALRARDRRTASRSGGVSLATIRESLGLDAYLDGLEERLAAAVEACPGLVATVGAEALASGGKRLRPLLVFLTAPKDTDPLPAGAAVELVHTATLVHDDLIDRAEYRRGRVCAWAFQGPPSVRAARA